MGSTYSPFNGPTDKFTQRVHLPVALPPNGAGASLVALNVYNNHAQPLPSVNATFDLTQARKLYDALGEAITEAERLEENDPHYGSRLSFEAGALTSTATKGRPRLVVHEGGRT